MVGTPKLGLFMGANILMGTESTSLGIFQRKLLGLLRTCCSLFWSQAICNELQGCDVIINYVNNSHAESRGLTLYTILPTRVIRHRPNFVYVLQILLATA